mmetsp:Transcript_16246/g.38509  ORF Transcript_16246/g.38509 Transcript_16246/m.38509 type:complete len:261 (-) Transcript_16246:1127-1909(-)
MQVCPVTTAASILSSSTNRFAASTYREQSAFEGSSSTAEYFTLTRPLPAGKPTDPAPVKLSHVCQPFALSRALFTVPVSSSTNPTRNSTVSPNASLTFRSSLSALPNAPSHVGGGSRSARRPHSESPAPSMNSGYRSRHSTKARNSLSSQWSSSWRLSERLRHLHEGAGITSDEEAANLGRTKTASPFWYWRSGGGCPMFQRFGPNATRPKRVLRFIRSSSRCRAAPSVVPAWATACCSITLRAEAAAASRDGFSPYSLS